MRPIVIDTAAGSRRLTPAELPIRIGSGSVADIRVPGPVTGEVIGLISSLDDKPFLQVTGGASALFVNGEPVPATRWLSDADVITAGVLRVECHFDAEAIRFSVAYTDTEYATLPPGGAPARGEGTEIAPRRPVAFQAQADRRRWSWLAYAALALLAAAALDLFTATAVRVEVIPADARVDLHGSWVPVKLAGRYLLRPGRYSVELSATGYEPRTAELAVGDARSQDFRYELRKLPGKVLIRAKPPVPVRVAVDGKETAAGPDGSYSVAAGAHSLTVMAKRYQDFTSMVEVEGREVRQTVVAELKPDWADVAVTTQPDGAAILVAGEALGTTPATVPVPAGGVELELRKDGYKPWRQTLAVSAGEKIELPLVRLQETDGLLAVVTNPAGAAVTIDGRYRGTTPLDAEIAPGGAHDVIVTRPGYETVRRRVTVERRAAASLRLDLVQRVGVVRIEADPPDAELLVNGVARGAASQELSLPAVAQRIEVRKTGFAPFVASVTPTPGLPQVVKVQLLTPQQAVLAATPRTVTTKQGSVLRLVEPGSFVMGAPRREQGRRPNESERPVRLTRRFYIGLREVTNNEFREFRPTHTSGAEKYQELAGGDHPVVMLSWEDAASFCNWLSDRDGLQPAYAPREGALRLAEPATTGYRLPTEAEWEWASRYNGGGGTRRYPWGDHMPPEEGAGNFADQSAKGIVPNVLSTYNDGYPVTAPVGSFKPSPLGLFDTGGNAAEWVNDLYTVYGAESAAEATDPTGPAAGQYHVIRGSSWRHASISELRYAFRDFGDQGRLDVGFRLARYAE